MRARVRNVLILLVLVFTEVFAGPRAETLWGIPYSEGKEMRPRCTTRFALDEDSLHRFDGVTYFADLEVRPDLQQLTATVTLRLTTDEANLTELDFRFTESLILDSVWVAGRTLTYSWVGDDSLRITVAQEIGVGDTIDVGFSYHGNPANIDAWGGFRFANASGFRPQIGWSMGDGLNLDPPPSNYNWLPTWADPNDKVRWDCWISGSHDQHTGGHLVEVVNGDSGITHRHYILDEPVSTYLLFIASCDYIEQVQRDSLPRIAHWVYPSREQQALTHFSNVPACLDGFVEMFGPYPFADFGFLMARSGDMEHATCVTHLDQLVAANHNYDNLLFHELSHMWWGDWVTLGDWRDLWLNEGFATYCEALGFEILGGPDAYRNFVVNELYPAARTASDSYSIYDPDYYWGATVYQKGACVLHMLRQIMGDSLFFRAWTEYGNVHAYGNAVTADFTAKCEQVFGQDLDWFFQPWLYGTRYPRFRVTMWTDWDLPMLSIEQIQTSETLFRMPVDVVVSNQIDTVRATIWVDATRERQNWVLTNPPFDIVPISMVIDPDSKILKTVEYVYLDADESENSLPKEFQITNAYPNPFNACATVEFRLPVTSSVSLFVTDIQGRQAGQQEIGELAAGQHRISWDGSNFSSGIYFFTISTSHSAGTVKAVLLK